MDMITDIRQCTKCELHKKNPQDCFPIIGHGCGNMVITEKPTYGTILGEQPDGIEYDYLTKIFNSIQKKFYYTHMVKCLGAYTSAQSNTCSDWIYKEIESIKPSVIFTLGNASKIFTKDKIGDITGKNIVYNDRNVVHLYSINYILKRGKKDSDRFIDIINNYAS
jgi:uracil-DNA glycosylase family 4